MWINSQNIDGIRVENFYDDLKDGVVLLKVLDRIEPGIVKWKKVEMNPSSVFKATNNCNYAVEIGKKMGFKLINIGGSDIYKKNKKLVLAYFW